MMLAAVQLLTGVPYVWTLWLTGLRKAPLFSRTKVRDEGGRHDFLPYLQGVNTFHTWVVIGVISFSCHERGCQGFLVSSYY